MMSGHVYHQSVRSLVNHHFSPKIFNNMKEDTNFKFKPLLIVSASKEDSKNSRIASCKGSLKEQGDFKLINIITIGLSELYNSFLTKKNEEKYDIVVFVHDDVYIDDLKLRGKLYKSVFIDGYDIVGPAGSSTCKIKEPALWHLMADKKTDWSGCVYHPAAADTTQIIATSFGPVPKRCLVLDGLFLAVNIASVRKHKWRFNTNYNFHHYDIASCIDANSKQLKLGTTPIHVVHDSPGLTSLQDPDWGKSQSIFLEEYK